jgi:hypothetical protein
MLMKSRAGAGSEPRQPLPAASVEQSYGVLALARGVLPRQSCADFAPRCKGPPPPKSTRRETGLLHSLEPSCGLLDLQTGLICTRDGWPPPD